MQRYRNVLVPALGLGAALLAAGAGLPGAQAGGGKSMNPVLTALEHPLLGSEQSMNEVQDYLENRVPKLSSYLTAQDWNKEAERLRRDVLQKVVFRGEATTWRETPTQVEWLGTIEGGPGYRIRKLRYQVLPGMWVPALLYEPENLDGRVPAVLNVNGHDANGKAAPYKQIRCINQAKRGMLALNVEWLGMGQLRAQGYQHARMNQVDLCGTSGLAPFYLAMKRGIDILISQPHSDPSKIAVTGLSGGGWQTIFISSLDTRVKLSNPVAGYSSFRTRVRHLKDLGDSEQTPCDLATVADYTHLTAMMAPRPTLLTYNAKDDCCFEAGYALPPLVEAARPLFQLLDKESVLRTHINQDPGTHNYEKDNRQAFYRMVGDHFYAGKPFDANEIPSESEVKTAEELAVPLPTPNHDFNTLARDLAKALPKEPKVPQEPEAFARWQRSRRDRLRDVVRAKNLALKAEQAGTEPQGDRTVTYWKLRLAETWTVPAVEIAPPRPVGTTLLLADGGRRSAATRVEALLQAGQRVVAIDPFYFGEARMAQKDYLFALTLATVGDRPLGLQASQVAAVARWLDGRTGREKVALCAEGPRTSVVALVAAGLEGQGIQELELRGCPKSLKEVIEQNRALTEMPELFCFGLLEWFDIPQLEALAAPRKVTFAAGGTLVGAAYPTPLSGSTGPAHGCCSAAGE